ncbi:hypothetical protein I3760_13G112000 [Carya illinoinensis]|nr:hypothetical protein I3760_13G112000 [Carya illinoinensis]
MLQVLFNLEGQKVKEDSTLSQLTSLSLEGLSALTHVWKNIPQGFQGFHNLMKIRIRNCDNLTYLFPTSVAKLLVQLQEVIIYGSELMENIIQREQEAGEERETDIIVFPKLSSFELRGAPNFTIFNMEACPIKLPSIKNISLWNCPKLKTFGSENQSRRKPKKMDTKLDSRAQGSPVVRDSPDFLGGCFESCVPHRKNYKPVVVSDQSISKRSKGSSSVGQSKHYNHGQIPNDPASTEVTLTKQEQSASETDNQVKSWSLIPSNLVESLQNLEELDVEACDLLEVIFQLEGLHVEESPVFDNLKRLSLASLPKLLHIWKKGPQEIRGFRNLESLEVDGCNSLKYLFPPSIAKLLMKLKRIRVRNCNEMVTLTKQEQSASETDNQVKSWSLIPSNLVQSLQNLEELDVTACDLLEVIFQLEGLHVEESPIFDNLKKLSLASLPKLLHIWKKGPQEIRGFRNLESLEVNGCDSLKYLFPPFIAKLLFKLKEIQVRNCNEMVALTKQEQSASETDNQVKSWSPIPSNLVQSLQNLEELDVEACDLLEVIFQLEGLHVEESPVFNNLKRLSLASLPKLLHIWKKGPQEIRGFRNLEFLEVDGCDSLKYLFPPSIAKLLMKLKKIRVRNCNEMVTLTKQEQSASKTDNQVKSWSLIPSNLVQSLQNLEELDVKACDLLEVIFQPEGLHVEESPIFDNLKKLSLAYLPKLLHIWKKGPQEIRGFRNLEFLDVYGCDSLKYLFPPSVAKLLMKLKKIRVRNCNEMVALTKQEQSASETDNQVKSWSLIPSNLVQSLQNLQQLTVDACDLLEVIFQLEGLHVEESPVFDNLEKLSLAYLPKLLHIWKKGPQEIRGFRNLESLKVDGCNSLKYLFPPSIAKLLMKLKIIRVRNCNEMVALTKQEQSASETDNQVKSWSLIPSNLVQSLQNLQQLTVDACDLLEVIFQLEGLHVEESPVFDNLEKLSLASLPKLLHIWKKGPQEIRGFRNLEFLDVYGCDSLKYLFPPSVAKLLMKLKKIRVRNCNEMNEILAKELGGDEKKGKVIVFPQVNSILLGNLPKLECFCNEANAFEWPSLEKIKIVRCNSLKMFVPTEMKTPKLHGVSTKAYWGTRYQPMVGDLNATIQHMIIEGEAGSNDEGSNIDDGSNEIYASSSS